MAKKNIYEGGSGLAAKDKVGVRRVAFIAHTIDKKHNQRVRVWTYKPVACWRVDEICFAFDSCFLSPETADALLQLDLMYTSLVDELKENELFRLDPIPRIALFGHADSVGGFKYNKQLSEDRAKAVFGMLTQDIAVWKNLFSTKQKIIYLQKMLNKSRPVLAVKETGVFDTKTENALTAYMHSICGNFKLEKKQFLNDGKAAFQGCGEYNPVRVLSKNKYKVLKKNYLLLNMENASNRRVMAFLFLPGTTVRKSNWPCGYGTDTTTCEKIFFRNWKKKRIGHQESTRTCKKDKNTFACQFYTDLAKKSVCEVYLTDAEQRWKILLNGFEFFDYGDIREGKHFLNGLKVIYKVHLDLRLMLNKDKKLINSKGTIADISISVEDTHLEGREDVLKIYRYSSESVAEMLKNKVIKSTYLYEAKPRDIEHRVYAEPTATNIYYNKIRNGADYQFGFFYSKKDKRQYNKKTIEMPCVIFKGWGRYDSEEYLSPDFGIKWKSHEQSGIQYTAQFGSFLNEHQILLPQQDPGNNKPTIIQFDHAHSDDIPYCPPYRNSPFFYIQYRYTVEREY